MTLVAAVAAGLCAALLLPAPPKRPRAEGRHLGIHDRGAVVALGSTVGALALGLGQRWLVPALVGVAAAVVLWLLWQRRRERRERYDVERWVLETCEQLAGELAAGQPPGAALGRAAEAWPALRPVSEAFRVGADVPTALREVAAAPGAGDLGLLAAAWAVAHRTGQGLASAVDRVALQLAEDRATRRVVDGELASARATARLVAVLPVFALLMGSGAGADPVGFLLTTPAGWACLGLGLGFGLGGLWWIETLARDVERGG